MVPVNTVCGCLQRSSAAREQEQRSQMSEGVILDGSDKAGGTDTPGGAVMRVWKVDEDVTGPMSPERWDGQ